MTFSTDRLNRLREDARMMRIYHDDHGIQEVIALCDAFEDLQAERNTLLNVMRNYPDLNDSFLDWYDGQKQQEVTT